MCLFNIKYQYITDLLLLLFTFICAFNMILNYVLAILVNPGNGPSKISNYYKDNNIKMIYSNKNNIKENEYKDITSTEEKDSIQVELCNKCNKFKLERTHHCSLCNKCILKMDHHCPWLANCIGLKNQKYFILFLFYTSLSTILVFISFLPLFIDSQKINNILLKNSSNFIMLNPNNYEHLKESTNNHINPYEENSNYYNKNIQNNKNITNNNNNKKNNLRIFANEIKDINKFNNNNNQYNQNKIRINKYYKELNNISNKNSTIITVICILTGTLSISISLFLIFHLYLITVSKTTLEYNLSYFRRLNSPYKTKSKLVALKSVLGNSYWIWLLPVRYFNEYNNEFYFKKDYLNDYNMMLNV